MTVEAAIDVVEEADVPDQPAAVAVIPTVPKLAVTPQVEAGELKARLDVIQQAQEQAMVVDVDYGVIPGTNKPTLLKPGAEKLSVLFQLDVQLDNQKDWGPGDHLTVTSKATVFHAPTGSRLGYGEGICTTRERKYAYRRQDRVCPQCDEATIKRSKFPPKGKPDADPGWYCYAKIGGCGANFEADDDSITSQTVGDVENPDLPDLWNCVTPETRVLTRDLRWVPAGDLDTGDVLIGVNEDLRDKHGRRYEDAIATVGERFTDELFELKTEDGRTVRCNGEHRWLVKGVGSGVEWVTTEDIYMSLHGDRRGRPRGWKIMEIGSPWEPEASLEAGYLAGLLDADGSLDVSRTIGPDGAVLYNGIGVSFAQQEGGVLDRFIAGAKARGFAYGEYIHSNPTVRVPVTKLTVQGGFPEQLRFLGTIRPPRLLDRWRDLVDLSLRRFEGRSVQVASIDKVGAGELVRLGTSSRTYIAEGLVCHNTVVKMAEKRARVDAVLAVTGASALFTQDMEDSATAAAETSEPAKPKGASESQLNFLDRLLGQKLDSDEARDVRAIVPHLNGQQVSEAIAGLKDGDVQVKARLVEDARAWLASRSGVDSEIPADKDGLEESGDEQPWDEAGFDDLPEGGS